MGSSGQMQLKVLKPQTPRNPLTLQLWPTPLLRGQLGDHAEGSAFQGDVYPPQDMPPPPLLAPDKHQGPCPNTTQLRKYRAC